MKSCRDCGQEKPYDEFSPASKASDGRTSYCRDCLRLRHRAYRDAKAGGAPRRPARDYHLKRRYGLTSADVDAMVEAQGGVCALCRERKPEHVDHDHVTGVVRGVLCFCCNQGLGNFRDRADVMRHAISYLERTTWQKERVCTGVYRLTTPRPAAAPSASSSELQRLISSRRG